MVDISEKIGRASCSELQNDFPAKDVMFLVADVTKREQLVKCVCSFVGLPPPCNVILTTDNGDEIPSLLSMF